MAYTRPWPGSGTGRPWPIPPVPADALVLHHHSDTHFRYRQWTDGEAQLVLDDINHGLVPAVHASVHTGDIIDGNTGVGTTTSQDSVALPWMQAVDGPVPRIWALGNHDLAGRSPATAAAWADAYGQPANAFIDVQGVRLVAFAPEVYTDDAHWTITDATWSWMDSVVSATPGPVVLLNHYPAAELGMGPGNSIQPTATLTAFLGSHPSICGMLTGHMHFPCEDSRAVQVFNVAGRNIAHISDVSDLMTLNVAMSRDTMARLETITSYITVLPDQWQIRYRRHGQHAWSGPEGLRVTTVDLIAGTVVHGN